MRRDDDRWRVMKKLFRRSITVPPEVRPQGAVPPQRGVGKVPAGAPHAEPPTPHVSAAPVQRTVGRVPHPRRLKLVRDVGGGDLLDLFAVFPDLPRPLRPAARVPLRRRLRRA